MEDPWNDAADARREKPLWLRSGNQEGLMASQSRRRSKGLCPDVDRSIPNLAALSDRPGWNPGDGGEWTRERRAHFSQPDPGKPRCPEPRSSRLRSRGNTEKGVDDQSDRLQGRSWDRRDRGGG